MIYTRVLPFINHRIQQVMNNIASKHVKRNFVAVGTLNMAVLSPLSHSFSSSTESLKYRIGMPNIKVTKHEHDHDHDHGHHHEHDHANSLNDESDEMEQEDMFVDAHHSFGHTKVEWGGPRRGGRFEEPTRFGDWERKGRCTDF